MNYEPAIQVLRDYASKSRQAAIRSSDAGFPKNATHCRELADIYDASVDLLQRCSVAGESQDEPLQMGVLSTRETFGPNRCQDKFLSDLGGILG